MGREQSEHPFHPLAEMYPLMGEEQLAELAEDIRTNGQRIPVVLWRDQVIDGRNRYLACQRLGINCRTVEECCDEEELPALIESLNEHRRHLTPEFMEERRKARIARVAKARRQGKSQREIAESEGISQKQVRRDIEVATESGDSVDPPDNKVTGRDGRTRDVSNIGKRQEPAEPTEEPGDWGWESSPIDGPADEPATPAGSHEANGHAAKPAGRKPAAKAEPEPEPAAAPVDGWGIPIQPHAEQAFAAVEKFKELLSAIQKAKNLFNEVANLPGGAFLTLPGVAVCHNGKKGDGGQYAVRYVSESLERVYQQVKSAAPAHTVCPYQYADAPHEEKCRCCLGLNWTPALGGSIPAVCIARAREAFGVQEVADV